MDDCQGFLDTKLLPCPFCGNSASIRGSEDAGYCVVCDALSCYCAVGEGYSKYATESHSFATEAEAAESWNRRSPSAGDQHGK